MADTYTQIYIHYVFATKTRIRIINSDIQEELYNYVAGLTRELGCFLQCIGGMEDHMHLLIGLHPTMSVSTFAQKMKANTSRFINDQGWAWGKFSWQEGYGAFSVSQSGLGQVREYLSHQKEHHQSSSFIHEYESLLAKYHVDYEKKYLFEELNT